MAVKSFYVYVYFRGDGSPCYVGKGSGRRWKVHLSRPLNRHLANLVTAANGDLPVVIVHSGLTNEQACEIEIALIRAIGRKENGGPLVNQTDGGDGVRGRQQSDEERERRRQIMNKPEVLAKLRVSHLGKPSPRRGQKVSELSRARMSAAQIGKIQSAQTIEKRAAKQRGQKRSADFSLRQSQFWTGKPKSETARRNMSVAKLGGTLSPEHRAAISAGLRKISEKLSQSGRRGAEKRWSAPWL